MCVGCEHFDEDEEGEGEAKGKGITRSKRSALSGLRREEAYASYLDRVTPSPVLPLLLSHLHTLLVTTYLDAHR